MKRLLALILLAAAATFATPAFAQNQVETLPATIWAAADNFSVNLWAVRAGTEPLVVVAIPDDITDESEAAGYIERVANLLVDDVMQIGWGPRPNLKKAGEVVALIAEYVCDLAILPTSISFTTGFSAGVTLLTTLEFAVTDVC